MHTHHNFLCYGTFRLIPWPADFPPFDREFHIGEPDPSASSKAYQWKFTLDEIC